MEIDADLNDEFHTQYDSQEYQAKISRLLHSRYTRLKTSNPGIGSPVGRLRQVLSER